MFKSMKGRVAAMVVGLVSGAQAMAGGLDYSTLTGAIDFDDVGPAVLTAAGALCAIYVIIKGVRFILSFARGG